MEEFAIGKWTVRAIILSNGRLVMHVLHQDGLPHIAYDPDSTEDRIVISFDPSKDAQHDQG